MRRTMGNLVSVAALALAVGTAADGAGAPLHIRPGLWQVTSVVKTNGLPGMDERMLAQLPPAQRAKIEASIRASMAQANKPHTTKSCVTQKDLERPFHALEDRPNLHCSETVVSSSWNAQDIHIACKGGHGITDGSFHFDAPTPTSMEGVMNMTFNNAGHSMSSKVTINGIWLGADCGAVKPGHS